MGERGSSRDPIDFFFRYPFGVFSAAYAEYDGYAASETEGSLVHFSLGRFLKLDLYATCIF